MTSLRSRLIVGSALVALVPLVASMVLLSRQVESTVRTEATTRLDATLGGVALQLAADGERIAARLEILSADPQLKRLYLLHPAGSRELNEYLDERRVLLGLDFLQVADTSGAPVADAALAASALARGEPAPGQVEPPARRIESTGGRERPRLDLEPLAAADSGLALAANATIRYEREAVGSVHGGLVLDARLLARLGRSNGVDLALIDASGRAVATTLATPAGSAIRRSAPLAVGAAPQASLAGTVSTAAADRTVAALRLTSLVLGLLGLTLAILLGVLWSSQVSRPVERLAAFSQRLAQGDWEQPLALESVRELETLVAALDRMRRDLLAYRERLVASERQAAWGQMARTVAHEIRNPLTPIAIAMSDLKRSYEQGRPEFPQILEQAVRTVGEEVESLKRLVQEFSEFGRMPAPNPQLCRVSELFEELETLYGSECQAGRLVFPPRDREITLNADLGQLRQAMINLIRNGLEAVDGDGRVTVSAGVVEDAGQGSALEIAVADTGLGLTAEQRANLFVPGFTTKAQGSGLGLAVVARIVSDHHGTVAADGAVGHGTTFRIRLPI